MIYPITGASDFSEKWIQLFVSGAPAAGQCLSDPAQVTGLQPSVAAVRAPGAAGAGRSASVEMNLGTPLPVEALVREIMPADADIASEADFGRG
ncbi:hypothetical protein [Bosea sp. (in: a-proteobacteria)]|uniref:hypothetical protein n=1 Tax=Bosea sp. (in: a-proteobacteria) TaxID=1871050 RepID=UPI00261F3267|nr:hypothetical protein [Bosea sp. (in: a-proteobacteria)]MCO5092212.1 hypothetical protein [Bosea sp. (in: a-proteobacteria)]